MIEIKSQHLTWVGPMYDIIFCFIKIEKFVLFVFLRKLGSKNMKNKFLFKSLCFLHCEHLGQNHLETNFAETNFPNAKTLIWANQSAQISVFAETNFPNTKTLIWANQNAQISVFTFGKLVSAKSVYRWFCR